MSDPFLFGRNRTGQLDPIRIREALFGIKSIPQNENNRLANLSKFKHTKNDDGNSESLGIASSSSKSQERRFCSPKKQGKNRNRPRKLDFGSAYQFSDNDSRIG